MRDVVIINRHLQDLNPRVLGMERCAPEKSFGPAVRKYVLIHCVTEGKGTVYKQDRTFLVHAGEAFLIRPGEVVTYTADAHDPWVYQWIGFDGALAKRFEELPDVFPMSSAFIQEMIDTDGSEMMEYRIASVLYQMYAALFSKQTVSNEYVRRVKDYIRAVYMQDLSVEEIASGMNLNRRYLSRFFKQKTGQTIQEYLIAVRMEEACKLLVQGHTVNEAAILCGYRDPINFAKMFRRKMGVSPGRWRATQK